LDVIIYSNNINKSNTPRKNEEMTLLRMKDAIGSTVLEELYGN
jgi:hypothetical protein